jgi:hypothetical protein
MPDLELSLWLLTVASSVLGGLGILWARAGGDPATVSRGQRLFVLVLLAVGAGALVAAFHPAQGLVPLGLLAGWLVVAMLWETPPSPVWAADSLPAPEKTPEPAEQRSAGPASVGVYLTHSNPSRIPLAQD